MTITTEQTPHITEDGLELIERPEDIPAFRNEAEEQAYWESHTFSLESVHRMRPAREVDRRLPPARSPSSSVTIRLNADVLHRLRRMAGARGIGYQTLLKQFITDRLYEEERTSSSA
jgi:uncharacterized NAD(P)/FAD-binding protein YdhS